RRQALATAGRQPLRARRQRRVAGRAAAPASPAGRPVIRLEPAGAEALLLVLAEAPDADLPLRIAALAERIRGELGDLLTDLVPGWTSLLLHYDLLRTDHLRLAARLTPLLEGWLAEPVATGAGRLHEIPVWYAGEDLAEVARACGLSTERVIELHSAREYRVGAIGFAPGFAYLGELHERLALPRRATPRTRVPAGRSEERRVGEAR